MIVKYKKTIAILALSFYSINAFAIIPVLAGIAAYAGYAAGSSALAAGAVTAEAAIWGSIALHSGIFSIAFDTNTDAISSTDSAPLQIHLSPNIPLSVPAGWQASTDGSQQPTPPNTVSTTFIYRIPANNDLITYPTIQSACDQETIYLQPYVNFTVNYRATVDGCITITPTGTTAFYVQQVNKCPIGYGLSGPISNQTCALLNSQLVMKPVDQKCTLIRNANSISPDLRDPDCSTSELLAKGIDLTDPSNIKLNTQNSQTTLKLNTDGSSQLKTKQPLPNGNTKETTLDFSPVKPSGAVEVIGKTIQEYTGQGSQQSTNPIDSPGSSVITFDKTGLATTSNQQSQINLTTITNTKLDDINSTLKCENCTQFPSTTASDKSQVDAEITKTTDLIAKQASESQHEQDEGMFRDLFSSPFPAAQSCTPFSKTIASKTITLDPCPYIDMIKILLTWMLTLYAAWDILSLIFRKPA